MEVAQRLEREDEAEALFPSDVDATPAANTPLRPGAVLLSAASQDRDNEPDREEALFPTGIEELGASKRSVSASCRLKSAVGSKSPLFFYSRKSHVLLIIMTPGIVYRFLSTNSSVHRFLS